MQEKIIDKYYVYLILLCAIYVSMHILFPNPLHIIKGGEEQWEISKSAFYDETNDQYFLSYDSYYYLNDVRQHINSQRSFFHFEGDLLSYLVYFDYTLFGNFVLSHYLSAIFGLLIVLLLYYVCFLFTKDELLSFCAVFLFVVQVPFFAATIFHYLDEPALIGLFLLFSFIFLYKSLHKDGLLVPFLFSTLSLSILSWIWVGGYFFLIVGTILFFCYFLVPLIIPNKKTIIYTSLSFLSFIMIIGTFLYFYRFYIIKYFSFIKDYAIVELQPLQVNWYYLLLILISVIGILLYWCDKEKNTYHKIHLTSYLVILIILSFFMQRFFMFALIFITISIALFLHYIDKKLTEVSSANTRWMLRILFVFLFVLSLSVYHIGKENREHIYDGGIYGLPFVEDALVNTGQWINKNTASDAMIITYWDYGIFYDYWGNRTAKFKSSPTQFDMMREFLYETDEEKAVKIWSSFVKKTDVLIVDGHWDYVRHSLRGKALSYPSENSMFERLLNNRNLQNFTIVYSTIGYREQYFVYQLTE